MFLDYAERMAEKGNGSFTMKDWAKRLEMFLNFNEYPVLTDSGKVKSEVAKRFAESEYDKFRVIQDKEYKSDFNRFLEINSINDLPSEKDLINQRNMDIDIMQEDENENNNDDFDKGIDRILGYKVDED